MCTNEVSSGLMAYLLGGKAEFTLFQEGTESSKSMQVKYRITSNERSNCYFIYVGEGIDFTYQGYFSPKDKVIHKGKKLSDEEVNYTALKALAWVFSHADRLPNIVHIYHNGKCSRCGRKLTDAESLRTGLGPKCRELKGNVV